MSEIVVYPTMEKLALTFGETGSLVEDLLPERKTTFRVERLTAKPGGILSYLHLRCIDTGSADGRIKLWRDEKYFVSKGRDRTFCNIRIMEGLDRSLPSEEENIVVSFNEKLEYWRAKYHSLFLINYRNTSQYQRKRKRIDFTFAY